MRDIFVKCFYVWTEIGPRTLSLTFFRSRIGMDFHFKILDWTRIGKNLSPLISTVRTGGSVLKLD